MVAQGQPLHVRTQTTHVHARVYGSARKSGRTNARWQLALATKGEVGRKKDEETIMSCRNEQRERGGKEHGR